MIEDEHAAGSTSVVSDIARSAQFPTWTVPPSALLLLRALAQHSAVTYRQSLRVASRAWKLSRALGLRAGDSERLWLMGLLHDVGMIHVPRSFLNARAEVRKWNERILWMHPLHGAALVTEDRTLATLAPAIIAHHERPDGSGYPRGLRAWQIPEEARFIAVIDSLDSIGSRPGGMTGLDQPDKPAVRRSVTGLTWETRLIEAAVELLAEESGRSAD